MAETSAAASCLAHALATFNMASSSKDKGRTNKRAEKTDEEDAADVFVKKWKVSRGTEPAKKQDEEEKEAEEDEGTPDPDPEPENEQVADAEEEGSQEGDWSEDSEVEFMRPTSKMMPRKRGPSPPQTKARPVFKGAAADKEIIVLHPRSKPIAKQRIKPWTRPWIEPWTKGPPPPPPRTVFDRTADRPWKAQGD